MLFKGTKKIPSSKDISLEYDNVGAKFNAHTTKRYTYYDTKCQDDYVFHCLTILADMLFHSTFNKVEFEKEERVVIEESVKNLDDPFDQLFSNFEKKIYEGSPFEREIDAVEYHSRRFDYASILAYYKKKYRPERMVLSIVSHFPYENIIDYLIHSEFVKKPAENAYIPFYFPKIVSSSTEIHYLMMKKNGTNSTHLSVGFRTCYQFSEDKYVLDFLKYALSKTTSSRLWMLLREKNGLTYQSKILTDYNESSGYFTIYTSVETKYLIHNKTKPGVLPLLIGMLKDLLENGIHEDEIRFMKKHLKRQLVLSLENNENSAIYNGKEMLLYGHPETIIPYREKYERIYRKITKTQIDVVIRRYFRPENMVVGILSEHLPTLNSVKTICEKM